MTGYGRADATADGVNMDISVKSVNGRYLDVRVHAPKIYLSLEIEIQKLVKKLFVRGTVDIYVQRTLKGTGGGSSVRFQKSLASVWVKELRHVLKELKITSDVTAQDLLNHVPGFVTSEDSFEIPLKEKQAFLKTLQKALAACQKARTDEGEFLRKTCLNYVNDLSKNRDSLIKLRDIFISEATMKMKERLERILGAMDLDPQRMLQEVGHVVERSDIEEELQRLGEHLKNVTGLLKSSEAQGKKLDFYAQELLREINTIGSKSQSAKITEIVVATKNTIEQLREQIQNIE